MDEAEKEEKTQPKRLPEPSFWGKIDILLKPIGGLATAAVVAYIGYLGSGILQDRQQTNAKVQLYAQIMSGREESETGLRREMFNSIIQTFLRAQPGQTDQSPAQELEQRLLALQLLTYNFHDALDLGPLFKYLERSANEIHAGSPDTLKTTLGRLKRTARDVIAKQIAVLEGEGETKSESFSLSNPERGKAKINQVFPAPIDKPVETGFWSFDSADADRDGIDLDRFTSLPPKSFRVEMITWDAKNEEVKVRLIVRHPETAELEIDEVFWVGSFDFPLIDNTRLKGGGRCAVVLEKITIYDSPDTGDDDEEIFGEVKLNLIYFPGSRASLKSRPYYDEVIHQAIGK